MGPRSRGAVLGVAAFALASLGVLTTAPVTQAGTESASALKVVAVFGDMNTCISEGHKRYGDRGWGCQTERPGRVLLMVNPDIHPVSASAASARARIWHCAAGQERVWVDTIQNAPVQSEPRRHAPVIAEYRFGIELCRDQHPAFGDGLYFYHVVNPSAPATNGQKVSGWINCFFLKPQIPGGCP